MTPPFDLATRCSWYAPPHLSIVGAAVVELTWLGQSGFVLRTREGAILIDPFLSAHDRRLHPPPTIGQIGLGVRWLLVTHGHADHLDAAALPRLRETFPDMEILLPSDLVVEIPGPHVRGVRPGDSVDIGFGTVKVLPAFHYDPGPYVGFLVELDGLHLYHSGDTIATEELLDGLRRVHVDVALLPINGRDFFRERRNLIGNLNPREAVQLAAEAGAQTLVPCHHDMMEGNLEDPGAVLAAVAEMDLPLHVLAVARGVPCRLPGPGTPLHTL